LKTLKTILCISALLVLTASTADAYVRRAVGGGYVARGGYHPVARGVARGAAVAAGTAAVAATGGYGWGGGWGTGYAAGPVAQPYQASVYGQGWSYGGGWGAPGVGYYGGGWGYPGGGYANTSYVTGRPTLLPRYYGGGYGWGGGWGTGYAAGPVAQPYQASVYGQGWNYGGDAPGTCYRDCDNYRKMLRESGYNVKNYRSAAGTVKQTAY